MFYSVYRAILTILFIVKYAFTRLLGITLQISLYALFYYSTSDKQVHVVDLWYTNDTPHSKWNKIEWRSQLEETWLMWV